MPIYNITEIPTFTTRCFNTRRYICTIYFTYVDTICTALECLNKGNFPMVSIVLALSQLLLSLLVYRDFNKGRTVLKTFSNYWISSRKIKGNKLKGSRISNKCEQKAEFAVLFVGKPGMMSSRLVKLVWDGHPYNFLGNLRSIKFNALLALQRLHQCSTHEFFWMSKRKN